MSALIIALWCATAGLIALVLSGLPLKAELPDPGED